MRFLPFIIGACVILGIIAVLASPRNSNNTGSTATTNNTNSKQTSAAPTNTTEAAVAVTEPTNTTAPVQPTEPPQPAGLAVGSTGETNGLRVTLNEVRHEDQGNIAPDPGSEYVIVNVTFENISKEEKSVSTLLSFSLKDDTGQKYNISIGAKTKGSADGSVAVGDKLRGESAFEVPKDAKGLVFIYDPVFGGDPLRFQLDK